MHMLTVANIRRGVVYTALGLWFAGTALKNEPTRKWRWSERIDPVALVLPDWRFFAPNPGVHDNHILFRDELPDGEVTDWQEVTVVRQRKLSHIVWYPDRREEKIFFDAINEIAKTVHDERMKDPGDVQITCAYLFLLNYLTHHVEHHDKAIKTQFLITRSDGRAEQEEPLILFLSNLHPVA